MSGVLDKFLGKLRGNSQVMMMTVGSGLNSIGDKD